MSTPTCDILTAIPSADGRLEYDTLVSLQPLYNELNMAGHRTGYHYCKGSTLCRQRTEAVLAAREFKAKWLLFVDSDMVVPDHTGRRLVNRNVDVVSVMAFAKQPPFYNVATVLGKNRKPVPLEDWPEDELMEVNSVGFGVCLIRMDVFDRINRPWFTETEDNEGNFIGEDNWFCRRCKTAKIKVHVDTGMFVGHVGSYTYEAADYLHFKHAAEIAELEEKALREKAIAEGKEAPKSKPLILTPTTKLVRPEHANRELRRTMRRGA